MITITEAQARAMIDRKEAGYWELSLRDSLGAKPIVHDKQYCIFVCQQWYLVSTNILKITDTGRVGKQGVWDAASHRVECSDDELQGMIFKDMKRLEKAFPVRREVEVLTWIPAYEPPDSGRHVLIYLPEFVARKDENPIKGGRYLTGAKCWQLDGSPSDWEVTWWAEWPQFDPSKRKQ